MKYIIIFLSLINIAISAEYDWKEIERDVKKESHEESFNKMKSLKKSSFYTWLAYEHFGPTSLYGPLNDLIKNKLFNAKIHLENNKTSYPLAFRVAVFSFLDDEKENPKQIPTFDLFIKHGFDINTQSYSTYHDNNLKVRSVQAHQTILMVAARSGKSKYIKKILKLKPKLNHFTFKPGDDSFGDGDTALSFAINSIKNTFRESEIEPYRRITIKEWEKSVNLLIDAGADITDGPDLDRNTLKLQTFNKCISIHYITSAESSCLDGIDSPEEWDEESLKECKQQLPYINRIRTKMRAKSRGGFDSCTGIIKARAEEKKYKFNANLNWRPKIK